MNKGQKYLKVYQIAESFLKNLGLEKSRSAETNESKIFFDDIRDINHVLFTTLTNRAGRRKIINFKQKEPKLKIILNSYDSRGILNKFPDAQSLFKAFYDTFPIKNAESKRNSWRQLAVGILSGSRFMSKFESAKEFDEFVRGYLSKKTTKDDLPLRLKQEIKGFGQPLACSFLKDIGYSEYAKADVHLIKLNSRSKCNTSPEDFRRSFKTQTFSGPVIEPSFDGFEFFERYFSKVSLFGQITANKTNGIFYSAFFPTVERRTEKGFCTKHAVGFQVVGVFGSIVVGQTQTSFLREAA